MKTWTLEAPPVQTQGSLWVPPAQLQARAFSPSAAGSRHFQISEVAVNFSVLLLASVCLPVDPIRTNVPTSER